MKKLAFSSCFGYFLLALTTTIPLVVDAETLSAGFPPQNIWLSKTNAVAGENISLYTALYNGSNTLLRGTLVFAVDDIPIASKEFELPVGQTRIESAEWRAVSGSHSFSASIKNVSGADSEQTVSIENTSGVVTVSIAEPPPPSALQQSINTVTSVAGTVASSTIPVVTNIAQGIISTTEAFREAGIAYAEKKLAEKSATTGTGTASETAGTATVQGFDSPQGGASNPEEDVVSKLGQLAASGILFTFSSPALFYFLLCLLILLGFYLLARWVNRPRL